MSEVWDGAGNRLLFVASLTIHVRRRRATGDKLDSRAVNPQTYEQMQQVQLDTEELGLDQLNIREMPVVWRPLRASDAAAAGGETVGGVLV